VTRWWRLLVVAVALVPLPARAQTAGISPGAADVHILPVQGNVYMLVTPTGNVTLQIGAEGALLVDTSRAETSDAIVTAIRSLTDKPIRYIINTSADADHIGGNKPIAMRGSTIAGGNMGTAAAASATIYAHENVLNRMTAPAGTEPPTPPEAWPTDTFFTPRKELFFNGEAIEILYQPTAHTDGDSIVFFRRSDVISAGDLFLTTTYPVIDTARGGTLDGLIAGLNRMLDIAIPKDKQEGGTYIIPGHGRLCDEADLLEYRDMLTIIRDRIRDQIRQGRSLAQVKAARPTQDYDGRFGATSGSWTTDMFVEAAYASLAAKK
jgi:glyoxylase-like metal-dependent hydrolase (beta-lactamase superfamily II)